MKIQRDEKWLQSSGKYKCPYCGKEYSKMGICTHIWRSHTDKGRNHNSNFGYVKGTRTSWNKGLTKEKDERIKKNGKNISKTLKKLYKEGKLEPNKLSEQKRNEFSERMSKHNPGGKSPWYEINGIKVQGSWELKFAQLLNEYGVLWERPNKPFKYKKNNKIKRYTPDFYLPKYDLYFEIKGYWWGSDKEKMKLVIQQNKNLIGKIKILRNFGSLADVVKALV